MNNTNTTLKITALAVIAGLYSTGAVAEEADGTAVAIVVEPIVIDNFTTMDFTSIAGGTSGGTLPMDDTGGIVPTGDAIVIGGGGGTPLSFDITGESGLTVDVSLSAANLSNGTPAEDMALAMDAVASFALTAGPDSVSVGGTLTVAGSQAAGNYTTAGGGSAVPITVTVSYQ